MVCKEIYKHTYILLKGIQQGHIRILGAEQTGKYVYNFGLKCCYCDYSTKSEKISDITNRIYKHLKEQHDVIIQCYPDDNRKVFYRVL